MSRFRRFLGLPPEIVPVPTPVEAGGSAKPAGELAPLYLPAKPLEDAHTPAERLDALVVLHAAMRYEKEALPDGRVQLALVWERGDKITGHGATPSEALGELERRAAALVRPS